MLQRLVKVKWAFESRVELSLNVEHWNACHDLLCCVVLLVCFPFPKWWYSSIDKNESKLNRSINNDIDYDDYLETFNAHRPAPTAHDLRFYSILKISSCRSIEINWNDRKSIKIRIKYKRKTNEYNFYYESCTNAIISLLLSDNIRLVVINHFYLFSIGIKLKKKQKEKYELESNAAMRDQRNEIIIVNTLSLRRKHITPVQIDESIAMNKSMKNELKSTNRS